MLQFLGVTRFPPIGMEDIATLGAAFPTEDSVCQDLLGSCGWADRDVTVKFREKSSAVRTMREVI